MKTLLTPETRQLLLKSYSEPHRHYHTLEHLIALFQLSSSIGVRLSTPQIMAIWYHDSIYDPKSKTNEEDSCQLLIEHQMLLKTISSNELGRAIGIIMDTKGHTSDNHESQTVLDLDLTGLGSDWKTYSYTIELIRKEYEHLSDDNWIAGRKLFLQSILTRNYIFNTHWGRDIYEEKAQMNISKELSAF